MDEVGQDGDAGLCDRVGRFIVAATFDGRKGNKTPMASKS
jgi:hypothetical protein